MCRLGRFLFFSTFLLGAISYRSYKRASVSEVQTVKEAPLICVESLEITPIDRMFRQIEVIVNKHSVNVGWLEEIVKRWKKGQKDFSLRLLLRIAVLFNVNPSVLLSSEDLESQVELYNFRAYLASDEDVHGLFLSVNHHLQNVIRSSGLTVSQIAERSGLSLQSLTQISTGHVPNFLRLSSLLETLNIDLIDFFKNMESSSNFSIQTFRSHFSSHWRDSSWENQQLQWIKKRVLHVIELAGIKQTIKKTLGIDVFLIHQRDLLFSSLLKLSNMVHISMSVFFNPDIQLSHDDINPEDIRKESLSKENTQKAYKVLVYLIKIKMMELRLSLKELAIKSGVKFETLRSILLRSTREDLSYLNLLKIVSKGFEMRLADFFVGFEELGEQFDHIDFNISLPEVFSYEDQKAQDTLTHLENRAIELINLTGISSWRIRAITGSRSINSQITRTTVAVFLRFVHIFGITFPQFAGNEDLKSLVDPDQLNLEKLPASVITNALMTLSSNIQRKLTDNRMSLSDLQIRMGAFRLMELNPILNGSNHTTIRKAVEVSQALDSDLPELFEGVSTF